MNYLDDDKFNALELRFMEEVMRHSSSKALGPNAWAMGTYLTAPLIQRNRKYSWICNRADFRKRSKLAVHYFRQRDDLSCGLERGGQHVVREIELEGKEVKRRHQLSAIRHLSHRKPAL